MHANMRVCGTVLVPAFGLVCVCTCSLRLFVRVCFVCAQRWCGGGLLRFLVPGELKLLNQTYHNRYYYSATVISGLSEGSAWFSLVS